MTAVLVVSGFVLLLCLIAHVEMRHPNLFERIDYLLGGDDEAESINQ